MATCRTIYQDCKRSGERRKRGFDLTDFCARHWSGQTFFSADVVIRVLGASDGGDQSFTGFDYVADEDGYSGEEEPAWPLDAIPVTDGSLSWSLVEISNDSLERTITGVEWIAPAGMTIDDEEIVNTNGRQQIAAYHAGGTDGEKLTVIARVTFSDGSIEDFGLRWTIKD